MKKRILALVLSAFMLVSNVQTAFAGTHTQATYIPLGSSSIEPATPELPEQPGGGNGSELSGEPSESDDDTEPPPESDSGVEEGSELPEELPEVEDFIDDEEPKSIEFDGFLLEDLGWSPWEENTIDDFYGAKVTVHPITEGLLDPAEVGYAPFIARTSSQVPMIRAAAGTKTQAKDLAKGDEIYLPVDGQQLSHKVMQTNYTGYNPNGTGTTALGIVIRPTQSPAMFDIEYDYTTIEALIRYDTSFERDWMESVWYNSIDASVRKYLKTPRLPIEHTYWESSGLNSSSPVSYNDNEYDYKVITTDHVFVPSYTEVTGQTGNTQVGRGWNSVSVYADWDGLQNTFFYLRNDRIHHYDISRVATTGDKQNDRVMRGGYATVSVDSSGTATMHTADRNVSNGGKTGSVEGSIGIVYGANSRNYGKAGYPSEQMVSTYIVPHYWIDPATPFAGNDFRENEPPTAPGAISGPGSVNAWDTSTITWTWGAATDPDGDTITYYVERNTGSGWSQVTTTNNTSYTYTIAAGVSSAQIRVRAYDGSEYSGYTTGTATTIVRDTTAPKITTIVSPAAGSYTKDNVQLSIVVEDSQSGPDYIMVDGTRYNGATATVSVTSNKTVAIEAYDKAGNKTTKNEVITQIDREGPVTTWNPSTQEITGGSVVVTVKATDAKAGVSYIENVTTGDRHYGDSWDIVFTSAQEVVLRAVDILGNIGPEVTVRVLNIDNQPPIVSYIITPREATAGTVDIVWTMVDTGSGPGFWEIPGSGEKHYGATYTQTVDSNGNYKIYAFDAVGNKAEETAPVNNIVKEPPAVTITVDKDGAYHNSSSAIVTVVATDAVAGIEKIILPDGSEVNAAKATFEITQNGKYTFEVVNKAGLSTTENLDYQWFDRSAPRLTNLYFVQTGRELDKRAMFGVLAALADNLFNQQVRMIFDYTDKPEDASSNEAESGVSHLTLQVFDSNGIPQNNKRTYQADNLDAIPDLDYELNGYVEIELFDYAGNSSSIIRENIVLDGTGPEITVTQDTNDPVSSFVTLHIRATDTRSGVEYMLVDGVRYEGGIADIEVSANKTVEIKAFDNAGNMSAHSHTVENIDTEAPEVTHSQDITGPTNQPVQVTFTGTDTGSGFSHFIVNGETKQGSTYVHTFTANGSLQVTGYDQAGNPTPYTATVDNIDTEAPEVTHSQDITGPTNQPVQVTFTGTDTGSGFSHFIVNGETKQGSTYVHTFTANGSLQVTGYDHAGNPTPYTATVDNIDTMAPEITHSQDITGPTNQPVQVTFTGTDTGSGFSHFIVNGETKQGSTYVHTFTANGSLQVTGYDQAGNPTPYTATVDNIDTEAPEVTHSQDITGPTNQPVQVTFTGTDTGSGFSHFIVNGETKQGSTYVHTFTANGSLQVTGYDQAGNPTPYTATVDNIDTEAPEVTHSQDITGPTNQPVQVTFTGTDTGSGFSHFIVNGETKQGSTYVHTFTANGSLQVTGYDHAGNPTPYTATVDNIDTVAPEVTHSQDITGPTNQPVQVTFTGTDTGSGFSHFVVNGEAKQGSTYVHTFTANGSLQVTGYDQAGNPTPYTATVDNIDTMAPEITHSQDITGPTNQPVQVTFTGTDAGSGFSHFIVNGETKQGSTYVHTFTANGSLQVTGYDHAGNPTPYTATVDNIDRTAPQLLSLRFRKTGVSVIKRAAAALFGSNETEYSNQQLELIFQYADTPEGADAESGVKSISYQVFDSDGSPRNNKQIYDVNDLNSIPTLIEEMDVYLEIMVTDHAGNTSEPYHYPVVLDNTKPYMTVEFDLPTWTDQNVTATIKGFDGLAGFSYFENLDTGEIQQGDTITHLFTDNDTARYRGFDRAGNYDDITITVDWIYRELASFDVTYSMEDYTRWPIITTVVASDPVVGIQTIKNLTTGETVQGDTITHTFTVNGTAEFEAVTVAGTPNRITASTDWLDLTPPQLLSVELEKTGEPLERISGAAFSILGNLVSNEQVRLVVTAADTPEGNDAESGVKTYTYRLLMDGETPSEWVTVPYGQKAKLPITKDSSGNLQVYVTDGVGLHSFQTRQDALDGKEGNPDTDIDDGEGTYPVIFETVPPVITWTYSTEDYTNRPVIVFATGEDEAGGSGWSHFTHENQSYYDEEHQINYRENGTEILTGHDRAGNETTEAITVTNIDLTPPSIDRLTYQVTDNDTVIFRVWGSDTPMGIDAESGVYNLVYRWYESQPNGKGIAISPVNIVPYADGVATEPVPYRNNIYVRAYLVDHAGNRSDQTRDDILNGREPGDLEDEDDGNGGGTIYPPVYDLTPPVMEYQLEPDGLTNRPVTANVTAEDLESGVDYLTAHGQRYPGNTLSLDFTENGAVPVNGYNNAGVGDTLNVVVGNIDLTPPVVHSAALKRANLGLVSGLARLFDGRNENAAKVAVNLVIDATDTPMGIDAESGVAAILYRIYNAETKQATSDTIRVPVEELANHIAYIGFNEYIRVLVDDGVGNRSNQTRDDILDGKNPGGLEDKDDGDDNGGIVMPAQLDETAPELAYTLNTTAPTQGNVIATIQGQDLESGFDRIEVLETGEMFYTNTLEYTFTVNKTLTFRGYDKAGNYADLAVTVANIDREGPEITITSNAKERRKTSDPVVLSITARDSSGITGITLPDGTVVKGNNTEYEVKENGTYVIAAEDLAGNTSMKTIEVNEITKPAGNGGGKGSGGGSAGGGRDYVVPPTIELPQGNDGVSQGSSNQDENQDWNTIPDHNYGNANDNPLTGADPRLRDPEEQELIRFLSVKLATHEDYIKIPHKYFNHMDKNATLLDKGDYVVPLLRDALYLTREADEFDEERTTFRDSEDELITILYFKHSDEKWQALQEEYSVAAKQAIEGMELGTAEECVWQIAEWIGQNITYDHSAVLADLLSIASTMQGLVVNNGAYAEKGVWRQGQAVCLGISKAAARMLQQSGLENQLVIGYHNGTPHAWSAVEIDGEWVWVDFTRCVGDTTGTATPFLSEEDLLRYTEKITA